MKRGEQTLSMYVRRIHERMKKAGVVVNYDNDPEKLLSVFAEWVLWMGSGETDWVKTHFKASGGEISEFYEHMSTPFTLSGFRVYAGMGKASYQVYKNDPGKGMTDTIELIEEIIQDDQLSGALLGAYNPGIVRTLLGMDTGAAAVTNAALTEPVTGFTVT